MTNLAKDLHSRSVQAVGGFINAFARQLYIM